jgi:uncharacterized membrane protein
MRKKYDTNPLDPDFPKRVQEAADTETLPRLEAETKTFPRAEVTHEQNRAIDDFQFNSAFGAMPNSNLQSYQTRPLVSMPQNPSRKVEKIGLPENIVTAIPYIPWFIGMIASIFLLLFVPRSEAKVRFHAAQGFAAHLGILIITSILGTLGNITGTARAGNIIFQLVTTIFLIVWTIKAYKGKPVHIDTLDSLTDWFDEKISPRR